MGEGGEYRVAQGEEGISLFTIDLLLGIKGKGGKHESFLFVYR